MRHAIAIMIVVALAAPVYAADLFDPPYGGYWRCPNGTFLYGPIAVACIPSEFKTGAPWWNACVAGRTDCVRSNTAYLGLDESQPLPHAKRGPGYCYTRQPYTCSPDGRLP